MYAIFYKGLLTINVNMRTKKKTDKLPFGYTAFFLIKVKQIKVN